MNEQHLWIYLLVVPAICFVIGYIIGRKTGWQLRDNIVEKEKLEKLKIGKIFDELGEAFHNWQLSIIKIKSTKKEEPLSLDEQLKKAVDEEDYLEAARIRNEINQKQ